MKDVRFTATEPELSVLVVRGNTSWAGMGGSGPSFAKGRLT